MKFKHLAILAVGSGLAVLGVEPLRAQPAASDTTERLSPLDSNPACMERNGPACVTDETGLRRVAAPPLASPVTVLSTPNTPAARADSQMGNAATRPSNPQFNGAVVVVPTTPVPGPGASTAPNVPAADQTGDFSAGRTRSAPGQSPAAGSNGAGNASTSGTANSGGGTMSKGVVRR